MKNILRYILFVIAVSSCCTEVPFENDERFWFDKYEVSQEIIFESNQGDLDTLKITNKRLSKPTGDCNVMVSQYDTEFARIDYEIKKDSFAIQKGWLIQLAAEPTDKDAIPVLRFLNMEFNERKGPLKYSEIELTNKQTYKVFVFDKSNCGMNYCQKFGLVNFKWNKQIGLISYENLNGEIWKILL